MELPIAEAFESRSEEYDRWYVEHSEIVDSEARAVASLRPAGFGVEVGVGSGIFASRLGVQIGIDPALGMLRKAASRGIACVRAVGEVLPLHDRCFDFALMVATLCFLQDADAALEEVYRVLTSDGVLIVCIIPRDSKWGLHYLKKSLEGHPFYSHAKFYTVAELETLLSRHGFSAVGWASTLSFGPDECPRLEEPSSTSNRRGFTCVKARKTP